MLVRRGTSPRFAVGYITSPFVAPSVRSGVAPLPGRMFATSSFSSRSRLPPSILSRGSFFSFTSTPSSGTAMRVAGLVVPHWHERRRRYATNEEGTVAAADAVTQTGAAVQSGSDAMSAFLATADPAPVLALAERTTSAFPPINWLVDGMALVHYAVPLSWAATIVCFTLAFRTVILPAVALTMQNSAKMRAVQPELEKIKSKYGPSVNKDVAVAMQYREEVRKMLAQSGVSTWKTIVPFLVQTPLFISFFFSTRKLAEEEPTLREASFLLFDNLAVVDPYYIMPVLTSLTMLATIELGSDGVGGQSNPAIKNLLRIFAVLAIPATSTLPIVTHIYWLTSNVFSLGQLALFKLPFVKKALNLPDYAGISPMMDGKQGPVTPEATFQRKPKIITKDE